MGSSWIEAKVRKGTFMLGCHVSEAGFENASK